MPSEAPPWEAGNPIKPLPVSPNGPDIDLSVLKTPPTPERVRLTPSGQSGYDGVQYGIRRVTARLYGPFAPDDLATTRRVLREIIERAPVVGAEL